MKIIIDGIEVEFQQGETIIQAAKRAGIDIPHFCWHPGLSISGNCRICLVEIEKAPKLMIACSTLAQEGMVVNTKNEKVVKAQNAVMEFLLINHPLDCPICDEAGECKLQDYAFKYSTGISRFDEEKNHKDKRVELGPNVMFDQERCISCSRCIRFCEEVAKEPQLTFVNRGEKVTIQTFPGKSLDNPYSMNVIEICPVGALTSRHFRFKSRVWDMSFTDSICPGCSRGCNTIIGVRNNEILRIEPRENQNVNQWWLCDYGRLETIRNANDKEKRIISPSILNNENVIGKEEQIQTDWDEAIGNTVSILSSYKDEMLFIGSAYSTLEDNYALIKLAKELTGKEEVYYIPRVDESLGDDILRKSDMTPNTEGCKLLGMKELTENILGELKSKKYKSAFWMNNDDSLLENAKEYFRDVESNIQVLSYHGVLSSRANVLLPLSIYSEINGTFVNFEKYIQRLRPAMTTIEQERLLGDFDMSRLDKFGAPNDSWTQGTKFNARPGWKIIKAIAKGLGIEFAFENSEELFSELCKEKLELENFDYDLVGSAGYKLK